MTIDWTKPIETTTGRPARVLATDLKGASRIAIAVTNTEGSEGICITDDNGQYLGSCCIRNVREKRRGFVVLEAEGFGARAVGYFLQQDNAMRVASQMPHRVVVELPEWEVPQ